MKNEEFEIIAEAVRIEHEKENDRLFIVFEVKNQKYKQDILNTWLEDIKYLILDKKLIKKNE